MILIADDNEADARLILEALKENGLSEKCVIAKDGEDVMTLLHGHTCLPRLLVLDLNMPRKNGFQVLREMKADPDLRLIPVVVLTTSDADKDVLESYRLYANSFITKPLDMDDMIDVVARVYNYWFIVSQLPNVSH